MQTRHEIAAEAARIMVTQAQFNFRIAKQKAAERLGIATRVSFRWTGGRKNERHWPRWSVCWQV